MAATTPPRRSFSAGSTTYAIARLRSASARRSPNLSLKAVSDARPPYERLFSTSAIVPNARIRPSISAVRGMCNNDASTSALLSRSGASVRPNSSISCSESASIESTHSVCSAVLRSADFSSPEASARSSEVQRCSASFHDPVNAGESGASASRASNASIDSTSEARAAGRSDFSASLSSCHSAESEASEPSDAATTARWPCARWITRCSAMAEATPSTRRSAMRTSSTTRIR